MEECQDECGDQCGDSFTVVKFQSNRVYNFPTLINSNSIFVMANLQMNFLHVL